MRKRDIVVKISNESGLTQQTVMHIVQRTLDLITDALAQNKNVELRNFGVFEVKRRKPRIGRNPNNPEKDVPIPERTVVKFKQGKVMRERVSKLAKNGSHR